MKTSKNKVDMKALDSITDQVLKYKPPRNSPTQVRPKPVDAKESTPGASIPNSNNNIAGETPRTNRQD